MSDTKLLDHWSAPEGAGNPVACLATSFTFQADFFTQDCLARFLKLSTVTNEGDAISCLVALLEEEDRLSETQVSVLVDRSSPSEKRNLRWDLLPIAVPGGLLHAKVAVLVWERSARVVLGSANLTSAGYRSQVELGLAIDLDADCQVPKPVLIDLVNELHQFVDLVPSGESGPKYRARQTVRLLADRVDQLDLPAAPKGEFRMALAPARPGLNPLTRLPEVWKGSQPVWATVVSPFWDDSVEAPAIEAIWSRVTGRPATRRGMTLVVATDPTTGVVQAPSSIARHGAEVMRFDAPEGEQRRLHAKLILMESDDLIAAMIGSSNATEAGLGLNQHRGHHELNLWVGCPSGSVLAKQLRGLARLGDPVVFDEESWEPESDEDELTLPVLPLGFETCTLMGTAGSEARLTFMVTKLPSAWDVRTPTGTVVLDSNAWSALGSPSTVSISLAEPSLPTYLLVNWRSIDGESCRATWTANVDDRSILPPPDGFDEVTVEQLLAALASTRPLPFALERELRRKEKLQSGESPIDLDPLHRYDDSALLLQRTRRLSLALWRLQERLGRPATNLDAIHWRLHGTLGPLAIADGLVRSIDDGKTLPGEAQFILAELALTVSSVDWASVVSGGDYKAVRKIVDQVVRAIDERRSELPPITDTGLGNYIRDALAEAKK